MKTKWTHRLHKKFLTQNKTKTKHKAGATYTVPYVPSGKYYIIGSSIIGAYSSYLDAEYSSAEEAAAAVLEGTQLSMDAAHGTGWVTFIGYSVEAGSPPADPNYKFPNQPKWSEVPAGLHQSVWLLTPAIDENGPGRNKMGAVMGKYHAVCNTGVPAMYDAVHDTWYCNYGT